jgi:chromosome segregation ATPase
VSQPANSSSTYKYTTIREDLEDMVYKISPLETPVMQAIGRKGDFENTYHEWSTVELAAANADNKTIEGDDATNDAPTTGNRFGNYAQLMDKVAQVTTTAEKVKSAGGVQKMAKQVLFKTQEIKRDMEARLVSKKVAVAGSDTVARETAGIAAFIRTNASRGATGANGTLSGTTVGYPNALETAGTNRAFTETLLKTGMQGAWTEGGQPEPPS